MMTRCKVGKLAKGNGRGQVGEEGHAVYGRRHAGALRLGMEAIDAYNRMKRLPPSSFSRTPRRARAASNAANLPNSAFELAWPSSSHTARCDGAPLHTALTEVHRPRGGPFSGDACEGAPACTAPPLEC
eukprot:2777625-Prymnesium_polylepis.3